MVKVEIGSAPGELDVYSGIQATSCKCLGKARMYSRGCASCRMLERRDTARRKRLRYSDDT
jgi:hypothetical protein